MSPVKAACCCQDVCGFRYADDRSRAPQRREHACADRRGRALSGGPPRAASSAPRSSWSERGTRTPTRSPTPCASPSRRCANGSANPRSSPRWPASATASTQHPAPDLTEGIVNRAPGLSVRLGNFGAAVFVSAAIVVSAFLLVFACWAGGSSPAACSPGSTLTSRSSSGPSLGNTWTCP